jgi:WD40 repeat protein
VLLYHTERRELLGVLPFTLGHVEVLRFTADGSRLLAAGGRAGTRGAAVLYDVATGAIEARLGGERDTVLAAAVDPGGTRVALSGPAKKVRVYAVPAGERLLEIDLHDDFVLSLDYSPDGRYLASADRAGVLGLFEADTGREAHVLRPGGGALHAVRFRPDGRALAAAAEDGSVRCYGVADGELLWSKPHGGAVLALSWSAQGTLASAGADGRVVLWQQDGASAGVSPALEEWLYALAFGHRGERLFAGDWAGRMRCLGGAGAELQATLVPAMPEPSS